jgi:hypothetical protein
MRKNNRQEGNNSAGTGILWVDAAGHFNANLLTPFHFAAQQLPASVFLRMMRKISHFVTGL